MDDPTTEPDVVECASGDTSSDDVSEGPPGLAFLLAVTDDVVRATALERLAEVRTCVEHADGGGASTTFHPYRVAVDVVEHHTPGMGNAQQPGWSEAGAELVPGRGLVVLDYHSSVASWVTEADVSFDLVGLQRLSDLFFETTGARFAVTFLVEEAPDGSWRFLDPVTGDEMTAQMSTITSELGREPWEVLRDYRLDIGRHNNGLSSPVWDTVHRVTYVEQTEPSWWDEDAAVVGLRQPGEELAVTYVDPHGQRSELGRISGVAPGDVAVVTFMWDDATSVPSLGEVRPRPATEWETGMAGGMGIGPDGSIDLELVATQS